MVVVFGEIFNNALKYFAETANINQKD